MTNGPPSRACRPRRPPRLGRVRHHRPLHIRLLKSITVIPTSDAGARDRGRARPRARNSASTVTAPTSACASFSSLPPSTVTSTVGWSASATAIEAVRDHARVELGGRCRRPPRGRARVEEDDLAVAEEATGRFGSRPLPPEPAHASPRTAAADRRWQRAAVNAPKETRVGELPKVASHRVWRHREHRAQLGRDYFAVGVKPLEYRLASLFDEHVPIQA